jgi:hypothetical protein
MALCFAKEVPQSLLTSNWLFSTNRSKQCTFFVSNLCDIFILQKTLSWQCMKQHTSHTLVSGIQYSSVSQILNADQHTCWKNCCRINSWKQHCRPYSKFIRLSMSYATECWVYSLCTVSVSVFYIMKCFRDNMVIFILLYSQWNGLQVSVTNWTRYLWTLSLLHELLH